MSSHQESPTCRPCSAAKKQCTIEEHPAPVRQTKCKAAEDDNTEAGLSKRVRRGDDKDEGSEDARTEALRALTREVQGMSAELRTMRKEAAEGRAEMVSAVRTLGKGFNTFLMGVLEPTR